VISGNTGCIWYRRSTARYRESPSLVDGDKTVDGPGNQEFKRNEHGCPWNNTSAAANPVSQFPDPVLPALQAGVRLDSRSQKIKDSLEAAETARLEAESSAEKVEAEIASARQDGQKIVAEARDAASKFREQEQGRAREEVEAMLGRARTEIAREKDATVEEVRKEFAALAIAAAERIVEGSLDAKAHSTLIDRVLEEGLSERKN
jgi:F-type H+-transporting ATPase subunit b